MVIYGAAKCPTPLIYVAAQRAAHSTGLWPFIVTQRWSSSGLDGSGWLSHLVRQALLQRFTFSINDATWIVLLEAFILRITALIHGFWSKWQEFDWRPLNLLYYRVQTVVSSLLLLMELLEEEKKKKPMTFLVIQRSYNDTNDSSRCLGYRTGYKRSAGSVAANEISPQKEAKWWPANKLINWCSSQLELIISRALLWHA